jgi:hypothetical protein
LHQFIAQRSALNLPSLANNLGADRVTLNKIITGLRKIPQAKHGQFLRDRSKI